MSLALRASICEIEHWQRRVVSHAPIEARPVFPPFLEQGPHPFPFRTRKLSPASAMVLQSFLCGRVARRWDLLSGVAFDLRVDAAPLSFVPKLPSLRSCFRFALPRSGNFIRAGTRSRLECSSSRRRRYGRARGACVRRTGSGAHQPPSSSGRAAWAPTPASRSSWEPRFIAPQVALAGHLVSPGVGVDERTETVRRWAIVATFATGLQ